MTYGDYIREANQYARRALLGKRKKVSEKTLGTPVASWLAEDRLHTGPGWEFVLILRTRGCEYGRNPEQGCTMCGYLNDAPLQEPTQEQVESQFAHGYADFLQKREEQALPEKSVVFKVFTSGSFFDPKEIHPSLRDTIVQQIAANSAVAEIAVESRPEYVTPLDKAWLSKVSQETHLDVGVGLESTNDSFREIYVQKGFSYAEFLECHARLNAAGAGTKVYLTLKPPYVAEGIAIWDVVNSMQVLLELGVDTISVNPVAVQRNTLVDVLRRRGHYRPPWLYSVLYALELGTQGKAGMKTRILCDPIAGGRERGTHNCRKPDCNREGMAVLREAVMKQAFSGLLEQLHCWCHSQWKAELALLE